MADHPKTVSVTAYLVLEPKWGDTRYPFERDEDGEPLLIGGKVAKVTANRPNVGKDGGVVTKVTFEVDSGLFLPLRPEAVVHVYAGNAEVVEVEAVDPREEGSDG